jgi:hypothetical protein
LSVFSSLPDQTICSCLSTLAKAESDSSHRG